MNDVKVERLYDQIRQCDLITISVGEVQCSFLLKNIKPEDIMKVLIKPSWVAISNDLERQMIEKVKEAIPEIKE